MSDLDKSSRRIGLLNRIASILFINTHRNANKKSEFDHRHTVNINTIKNKVFNSTIGSIGRNQRKKRKLLASNPHLRRSKKYKKNNKY